MRKTIKMKNNLLLLLSVLCWPVVAQTHDPTVVRFVNVGKMLVEQRTDFPSKAVLFIPDGFLADSVSSIVQDGITAIGGNFYQNALSKVFKLRADSFTVSTGTVRFMSVSDSSKRRTIALWPAGRTSIANRYTAADTSAVDFFRRGNYYLAFPNIEIATDDSIHVEAVLGMDAIDIRRTSIKGVLYLEAKAVANAATGTAQIFDASLRVTGNTVTAGAVVIAKYILPFRDDSGNKYLYPFAAPYTNQRAGYFAGNWVRAPQMDTSTGHYAYPYANKKAAQADHIDASQYVRYADDYLTATRPYLLWLQPNGFGYDLPFIITGGEEHDIDEFIFNGTPHNLLHIEEQKFTGNLYERTPSAAGTKYQWLIGNSYTAALSIDSLSNAIILYAASFCALKLSKSWNFRVNKFFNSDSYFMQTVSKNSRIAS
ncbi:hypothetical protein AGMMS50262_18820 [Bacteroidia bacterium]|nr:hypothetical protein AGMMS50262_18820 [Bacteroidia bacterium]